MIEGTAPAIVLERCDSPNLSPLCLHTLLCIVVRAGGERFGESHLCKTMGACCSFYLWYIFLGHDIFYLQFWVPHKPVNIFSNTEIILARYSNINIENLHFVACSRCQSLISSYTVVVHHLISYLVPLSSKVLQLEFFIFNDTVPWSFTLRNSTVSGCWEQFSPISSSFVSICHDWLIVLTWGKLMKMAKKKY